LGVIRGHPDRLKMVAMRFRVARNASYDSGCGTAFIGNGSLATTFGFAC
jgi:hypothetical protein